MAPRAYNNETRQQQQLELKARIAAAAAELHATQGALATSYAEIAERAGVSLPTVYKHFPSLEELTRACSAHVASQAPALDVDRLLAAGGLDQAARELVDGMDRLHAHFEPWLVWQEQRRIATLAELARQERRQLAELCGQLLSRHGTAGAQTARVWESLLSFELWHRLVREHGLSRAAARGHILQLLLAAAGPGPAAAASRGPKARKIP